MKILTNVIMGVVLIVFSILAYTYTTDLPERSAMFPQYVLIAIGITGALIIIESLIKKARNKEQPENSMTREVFFFQILIPGVILLVAYFLLTLVGFYNASFFLIIIVYLYQGYRANKTKASLKQVLKAILVAIIVTIFMYVVFTLLLNLPTPSGSLLS